jgi:hypothetical protein
MSMLTFFFAGPYAATAAAAATHAYRPRLLIVGNCPSVWLAFCAQPNKKQK